jgi:hypothetical protein
LPREKAGVASAVQNTVRQVGGALGVAVLGSVLSAIYRNEISGVVAALPEPARSVAAESISGAYGVADQAGPGTAGLASSANEAFVTAMHWAAGGSAIVAAISILVVLAWLPARSASTDPPTPPGPTGRRAELAERR